MKKIDNKNNKTNNQKNESKNSKKNRFKILALIMLLTIFLIIPGCKVIGNLHVNNSGGGYGTYLLSSIDGGSSAKIKKLFLKEYKQVKVSKTDRKDGLFNYKVFVSWTNPVKAKIKRTVDKKNDTIKLDFGYLKNVTQLTVHVNGNILKKNGTDGKIKSPSTVVFYNTGSILNSEVKTAYVIYHPYGGGLLSFLSSGTVVIILFALLFVSFIAAIIIAILLLKKRKTND